jgi:hypothetical protein
MKSGILNVWLANPQYVGQIDFADSGKFLDSTAISLQHPNLDMATQGWTLLGTATVCLNFIPTRESLQAPAVQGLQASLAKFDAECETKRQFFLDQIGKLQALAAPTEGAL